MEVFKVQKHRVEAGLACLHLWSVESEESHQFGLEVKAEIQYCGVSRAQQGLRSIKRIAPDVERNDVIGNNPTQYGPPVK